MGDIQASVGVSNGKQCYNIPDDQKVILDLLERVNQSSGGVRDDPAWKRPQDKDLQWGVCAPALQAAIRRFQTVNAAKLPFRPDGHIDPRGPALRLLNSQAAVITVSEVTVEADTRQKITLELHDHRILGAVRSGPNYTAVHVNPLDAMDTVLSYVQRAISGTQRIGTLIIMAHGIYANDDETGGPVIGVRLGRDLITAGFKTYKEHIFTDSYGSVVYPPGHQAETISKWGRFNGNIDEIRFMSCGAASQSNYTTGIAEPDKSGYEMCKAFARITGAYVIAAERNQVYQFQYKWPQISKPPGRREDWNYDDSVPADFGAWEGPVYVFSPFTGSMIATTSNGATPTYNYGD